VRIERGRADDPYLSSPQMGRHRPTTPIKTIMAITIASSASRIEAGI
jgi:hypothetical protein